MPTCIEPALLALRCPMALRNHLLLATTFSVVIAGVAAGCDVALNGVHIVPHPRDAGVGRDGSASPEPREDGAAPSSPHDTDGSVAVVDAGEPEKQDAGEPPEPVLSVYRFDFDQQDAPLPAPWSAEPGAAAIWGRRLCIEPGKSVELRLPAGRYGYVRADVPAEIGLELAGRSERGDLFSVSWQGLASQPGEQPQVALFAQSLASQSPFTAQRYELTLHYDARSLDARAGDAPSQAVPFPEGAGNELTSLLFRSHESEGMVCLDNVYVAKETPAQDPFATSLPLNVCVPATSDEAGRCLSEQCCTESIALFAETCWQSCDSGSCPCARIDPELCAARCLQDHPSHSISHCTDLCRLQIFESGGKLGDLRACAEMHCGRAPTPPPHQPLVPGSQEVPLAPAGASKRIRLEIGQSDAPEPLHAKLVEIDLLSGERSVLADLAYLNTDFITLYADPSHTRAWIHLDGELSDRLYTWNRDDAAGLREVRLTRPVTYVTPSDTGRYAWVLTEDDQDLHAFHTYLLDGHAVLFDKDPASGELSPVGPKGRYTAYKDGSNITLFDLVAGTQTDFMIGDGNFQVAVPFTDSMAFMFCDDAGTSWELRDLTGKLLESPFAKSPNCPQLHGGMVALAPSLYGLGGNAPLPLGTLPARFNENWEPLFGTPEQALYVARGTEFYTLNPNAFGLLLADASGSELATVAPTLDPTPEGQTLHASIWSAVPYDARHGLLVTCQRDNADHVHIDTYEVGAAGVTLSRVDEQGTCYNELLAALRADSSLYVLSGDQAEAKVVDVLSSTVWTLPAAEQQSYAIWAVYPQGPFYREAP